MSSAELPPSIPVRLLARLIDLVLPGLALLLAGRGVEQMSGGNTGALEALLVAAALGLGGFWIGLATKTQGATPGRALCGLRVRAADGTAATTTQVAARELLAFGLFVLLLALLSNGVGPALSIVNSAVATVIFGPLEALLGVVAIALPWSAALAIVYGSVASDAERRGLHDHLAGTVLVRAS